MRVLVTGSGGFIGRHLVAALSARGDEVRGLEAVGTPDGGTALVCDLLSRDTVIAAFREFQPEAAVHLAARTDLEGRTPQDYAVNTTGVANLLEAVRATSSVRRVVHTSSQLVCEPGYLPRHATDYRPTTAYGRSKVDGEMIVRARDGGETVWCIVRPTTVWGPGVSAHYRRFLRMIVQGRYFHVGRRPLLKSYGYVENVVHQYMRLLSVPGELIHRKTLYLADEPPLSLRVWADALQRAMGAPPIRTLPESAAKLLAKIGDAANALGFRAFPFNSFRLGNVLTEYRFDLSETIRICGPSPHTMEEGVARTAAWYLNEFV
jgi:nucleoside-diphosphate-sugar epimerase